MPPSTPGASIGPPRVLPLEGGRNFRDLGGYAAADGRSVRWGHVFRSGTLAHLTAADRASLGTLGLRTICDLRTTEERASEPTAWIPESLRVVAWDYTLDHGEVMGAFRLGTPTPEGLRAAITTFYRSAPEDYAERFTQLFRLLLAGESPLAVHCTAGKDRTGVAAALILRALDVPEATVIEDYALSDQVVNYERVFGGAAPQRGGSWAFLSSLPRELRAPLFASEPAYIEAMLRAVDASYGSVDGYLEARLGIDGASRAQLRDRYLE